MNTGTLTADGSTPWVKVVSGGSGRSSGTAAVQGNFGGGTATLEWSLDQSTATTATDADGDIARTAAAVEAITLEGVWLRWTLSGATSPDLDWLIIK